MSELRGCRLHIDGVAGAAGDMLLGALLDLGVPRQVVDDALAAIGHSDRLEVAEVVKGGIRAIDVKVRGDGDGGGHAHRHYAQIRQLIDGSELNPEARALALDIFDRVARAEARLHGTTPEQVAFHEVGAVDSIVDIVANAAAFAWLAPAAVSCAQVAMGHGSVGCAHGVLPVPSPAAVEVLREAGAVMSDGGVDRELCTPTGAAVLAAVVTRWGPMATGTLVAVGYGAGDAELTDRPNVVRVGAGRPAAGEDQSEAMFRLEANVDDMSPEMCQHAVDVAFAAGAVDVWWTPITMKKGRPALLMSALAPSGRRDEVVRAMLRETTTLGVRYDRVSRRVLDREARQVATRFGPIPVKVAWLDGEVVNAAPEYEACRAAARAHGVPLKDVFAAANAAYERDRARCADDTA